MNHSRFLGVMLAFLATSIFLSGCASSPPMSTSQYLEEGFDIVYQAESKEILTCKPTIATVKNPPWPDRGPYYPNCVASVPGKYDAFFGWSSNPKNAAGRLAIQNSFIGWLAKERMKVSPGWELMKENKIVCTTIDSDDRGELVECPVVPFQNQKQDVNLNTYFYFWRTYFEHDVFLITHDQFSGYAKAAKEAVLDFVARMKVKSPALKQTAEK